MARVRGVSRCAKNQNRTRTRGTRFKSTAGLPAPVLNPMRGKQNKCKHSSYAPETHVDIPQTHPR